MVVTFHPTSGDALGGQNAFPDPESYINTGNPQLIFVRVTSTLNGDWQVTTMDLEVLPTIATAPENIYVPDEDLDGFTEFDLTANEIAMIGGQDPINFIFSYFEAEADCEANMNQLLDPANYQNIANPQTLYVRVERLDNGCVFCESFDIETDASLGVESLLAETIAIYPNPTQNKITLQWDAAVQVERIAVYALDGKLITTQVVSQDSTSSFINLSETADGMYFIKISTQKGTLTEKIIKN